MVLIFDTETTGLPDWSAPSDAPQQPYVVDLACTLFDGMGLEVDRYDAIIANGVHIPEEAARIHGITTDTAAAYGVEPSEAFGMFERMVNAADVVVGFNVDFDLRMMRIMGARVTGQKWECPRRKFDVSGGATLICKLPPTQRMINAGRGNQFKKPRLSEAYESIFGERLAEAHRARPDCDATARLYFHITEQGIAA